MPSNGLTPTERKLRAQLGAYTSWANTENRTARTAKPRAAFNQRFEDEVDPERVLQPDERAKRAGAARQAYFAALALKSAKARRRRSAGGAL